uniref:uncharacterized protein LOC120327863 n=1 Tax=Styela clava TaxID=7725 RepID=UPI0019399661|nr:uncharacterized protein LOC120327863 [Styela clava]
MEQMQDETCPICLEYGEDLRILPCGHVTCRDCIIRMTLRGKEGCLLCSAIENLLEPTDPIQSVRSQVEIIMKELEILARIIVSLIKSSRKIFCIFMCVFVIWYFYRMHLVIWIILGASTLITRLLKPHLTPAALICSMLENGIISMILPDNLNEFMIFSIFETAITYALLVIQNRRAFNVSYFYEELICAAIRLVVIWAFFDKVFVHWVVSRLLVCYVD